MRSLQAAESLLVEDGGGSSQQGGGVRSGGAPWCGVPGLGARGRVYQAAGHEERPAENSEDQIQVSGLA